MDEFVFGNTQLQTYIDDYIHSQAILQTVTNPSGALLPLGTGLGEPKFNADGSRYNGNWGRPQRDGPPLRAIAMTEYSNYLIGHGEEETVKTTIWPVIANDLSYVGQYWYVRCAIFLFGHPILVLIVFQELNRLRPVGGSVRLKLLHYPRSVPIPHRGRRIGKGARCALHRLRSSTANPLLPRNILLERPILHRQHQWKHWT